MPSKFSTKRGWRPSQTKKKSQYKSRAKSTRTSYAPVTQAVATPAVGLGAGCRTVLKTAFYANLTTAGTGIYQGYFSPGSAFNPLGSISAIQPALFDQFRQMYSRYVVEKAYFKIEMCQQNNTAANQYGFVAAMYPTTDSGILSTFQDAASQPFSKSLLCGLGDTTSSNTITYKLDHAKMIGRKGPVDANENGASMVNNPPAGQYGLLQLFIQNAIAVAVPVLVKVTLTQTVWFDRRVPATDA